MKCGLLLLHVIVSVSISSVHGQPASPSTAVRPPKAVYAPKPVYRPEWAKQGLSGKGVVLVTIEKETGKVTGVRMLQSTGNKVLDGAALEAYSQWRFEPGGVSQVKMPIEFTNRPKPQTPNRTQPKPVILYSLLILVGVAAGVIAARKKRHT
jgi:TonB family protein